MGIVAPLAWLAVERLYLNTQTANLLAQAELVASALRPQTAIQRPARALFADDQCAPGHPHPRDRRPGRAW